MDNRRLFWRCAGKQGNREAGFSLIELLVTLAVFLVISGAAFSLVTGHMRVFVTQQSQAALNFGVRNAVAQLQLDLANAGVGFYNGINMPGWPVGVTIQSGTGANCHQDGTQVYADSCFDRLTIVKIDTSTPPAVVTNGGTDYDTAVSAELKVQPADPTKRNKDGNEELAGHFAAGDYVMVVTPDGKYMTVVRLSKSQAAGNQVQLQHKKTNDDGSNSGADDVYGISTTANGKLEHAFPDGSFVLRLAPAVYTVDTTDAKNPKLVRLAATDGACSPVKPDGTSAAPPYDDKCIIAEQVIGFKAGASLVNEPDDTAEENDCKPYCYNSLKGYSNDWSRIRAVRVTLIGRTEPSRGAVVSNDFDGGPYKIEALSVVSSPRGLSLAQESTKK